MKDTIEAKVRHRFTAPSEHVFDAWLDVDTVRDWMAMPFAALGGRRMDVRRVEIDPRVGGRFTFSDMREDGEAVHWGTYLEIDRPERLVFTWFTSEEEEERHNNSVVTLTIDTDGEGCLAAIVHRMDGKWLTTSRRLSRVGRECSAISIRGCGCARIDPADVVVDDNRLDQCVTDAF